jgi:uncharacterized membrane protein YfcA
MIDDPHFYFWAIPAVLLVGLAKSGFLSGFGAVATPLMAMAVSVPQAAAIMLPLLCLMDITSLQQLWKERDAPLLQLLVPAGLMGIALGTVLFSAVSAPVVSLVVGVLTLLFLLQRLLLKPKPQHHVPSRKWGFAAGVLSGFTSFVAHAGGPPISAYVLPMRLDPIRVTATLAVFFSVVNLAKWVPYAALGLFDARNLWTSLALAPLAPVGVWIGVWLTRRMAAHWFYRVAYLGMALAGGKLLWDGWRAL